ncbi:MAG: DegV family protein [Candidatus Pacebacteria bacterium]|nr:DegV family protein [Candidatus Paceibacterota bacterium]
MSKIKIITDSAAAIPQEIIEKNNIGVVNLKVLWPEEGINGSIETKELFKKMRETKSDIAPKTSQPSVGDFKEAFEEAFKNHDEIICIVLSTGISGTFNSATQAIKFLPKDKQNKVSIVDSFSADGAEGIIALKAVEFIEKGFEREETVFKLEVFKESVKVVGFPGDPKWIERNGRLSHTGASLIRKLEKVGIRPLLVLKKGKVKVASIRFKAKDKAAAVVRELEGAIKNKEAVVTITHADMFPVAEDLKDQLSVECPNAKILFIDDINPIIGCHLGPDSIICCYYLKENDVL